MHASIWFGVFLLSSLGPGSAHATLQLNSDQSYSLSGQLQQLQPEIATNDINLVASGQAGTFLPLPGQLIEGVGGTRSIWLRFSLQRTRSGPDKLYLRITPPLLDHIEFYQPGPDGWVRMVSGDQVRHSEWPEDDRTPGFLIDLTRQQTGTDPQDYYIRLRQNGLMNAYFILYPVSQYQQRQQDESLLFGLYFGVFFSLILINLLHWISLRERIFGELTIYLALRAAFYLSFNGLIFQWLLGDEPLLNEYVLKTLTALTVASQIFLTARVLELTSSYPRMARLYTALGILSLAIGVSVWFGWFTLLMGGLALALVLTGVLNVVIALDQLRQQRPLGRLLLAVMTILLFCQLAISLPSLRINSGMMVDLYGSQVGSLIISMAIHVAVAMRVSQYKKARNANAESARIAAAEADSERAARQEQADFVAMLFHEIKTPLAEIDSATTILEHLDDGTVRGTGDRYDTIHSAVERLNRLVEHSLSRDRQGLDAAHLNRTPTRLRPLAETVVNDFRGFRSNPLLLCGGESLAALHIDPEMVRVALANLIDNAIKYSPAGSTIRIDLDQTVQSQTLSVCDSGPGMDAIAADRAFDRYWRGNTSGSTTGAGLGLYLVRKIVLAHGGQIQIDSRPGVGSRFILTLPEFST
ncbi:sensor histidine kinase [Oceanobacter mangrovi]|uniref:sensor histidine kinase n=1 Tax=Oceanobacter mangrovi TaxID=2862510 RepID=UPI001C8D2A25|nr:sensor histidine kinase [Oceanobacter mangrovi]